MPVTDVKLYNEPFNLANLVFDFTYTKVRKNLIPEKYFFILLDYFKNLRRK